MTPDVRSAELPPVTLESVSVFYGEVLGLSKVTLALEPGITGIVGPNGSGKSTMMRVLTGLVAPAEGSARVLGAAPFSSPHIRRRIGFVPALECFYGGLSGRHNLEVAFLSQGYDRGRARTAAVQALELVDLTADGDRRYNTWSRGMRQRLKLGLVLVGDAEVVLLDEPFLGVDPPARRFLRARIRELGAACRTVLVSSHVLHEVEALTDRVGILAHGRLLGFGKIDQLLLDLRDRHPHRVKLTSDTPRRLATALLQLPHISEVKVVDEQRLEFITEHPEVAYRELVGVVRESGVLVRRVETLDNGLEAVFRHVTAAGTSHP